ncbi:DUF6046 domain-containing protein [Flavobacterium columnare]|uniref:DUF6046 domain-containing protein n=1 Tax=Flavobacterium columnare TaxID=996 RepID=A0AAI8GA16_9FLAO|nr:DUF6046 domain-containing protein [Flavobacterium columnare]AMO19227.1 hypothetical protein UN65_01625 [Flavobacterium columnare]QOG56178.1 hypothetical protein HUE29_01640 [Flavobacterium columnare]QOG58901.1 hypothetical protein HUE30_01640 [Flavobacterium columnare]QOG61623.1 hypothetical protein HUE31_01645 [Flavobacterium columnare]QOG64345.1 hypothetical protein HUE32_01645 [Flavobacterium columnare]
MAGIDGYKKVFNDTSAFIKNINFDLISRYAAAFGMMAAGNAIESVFIKKTENEDYSFETFPLQQSDVEYVKMVVPDLEPLEFSAILYGDKGSLFAPPLLIGFSQEKSLIETEVNDDDPIVIERWGTKPWDITMNGLLIDLENRIYPSDEIRRLNQNWKYNGLVKVIGKQFEERDIDSLYFKSISFTSVEGYQDTVQFTINASSIRAVNFTLLKPNS